MPIYDYQCENGHRFERRESFNGDTVTACPTCESAAQRVLHAPAVHYKGSGFYTTDHGRSSSYQSDSKADDGKSGKETASESKSEAKAESKPESKSETKAESTSTSSSKDGD